MCMCRCVCGWLLQWELQWKLKLVGGWIRMVRSYIDRWVLGYLGTCGMGNIIWVYVVYCIVLCDVWCIFCTTSVLYIVYPVILFYFILLSSR